MRMRVWDGRMVRTRESMRVMSRARKALESVFQYALQEGLGPESFYYVVNEAAQTIVLKYAVDTQLDNHKHKNKDG